MTFNGFLERTILVLSGLGLVFLFNFCNSRNKGRIELKFEKFVHNNFAEPQNYIEIASIELMDSTNIYKFGIDAANVIDLDSLFKLEVSMAENLGKLVEKIPYPYKRDLAQKTIPLASRIFKSTFYSQTKCKEKKDLLLASLNNVDSAKTTLLKYAINVRERRDDKIIIQRYIALDCIMNDSIIFSRNDIDFSSTPAKQLQEIITNVKEFSDIIRPRIDNISEATALIHEYQIYGLQSHNFSQSTN